MTELFADSAVSALVAATIKASALLGFATVVQAMLHRRASAATCHLVWTLAIGSVLLLPLASIMLPRWAVVVPTRATAAEVAEARAGTPVQTASPPMPSGASVEHVPAAEQASGVPWSIAMGVAYLAGVLVMLIRLARQRLAMRQFARGATAVSDARWTRLLRECACRMGVVRPLRLLRSRVPSVPLAFGIRRPSIVVPDMADTWPDDRRRAVILHELAHVARHDCLTQTVASAACAIYWFHPAAWWVARRMRIERELACDDRVIAAGTHARDYARHLLEIAYSLGRHGAPALAVSMARPRQLEGRLLAAVDDARNRSVPDVRVRAGSAAIAAVLLLPLAMAAPAGEAAGGNDEPRAVPAAASVVRDEHQVLPRYHETVEAPLKESARHVLSAAAALAQEALPGTWEIRPAKSEGTVRLRLVEVNSSSESNIPVERLEGLTAAHLAGEGGPIQFRLRRDAGTFTFEGVLRRGVGAGTFSFTPDPGFPAELQKRGFARPSAREQYQMARHDVGYAFVDELNNQGYAKPQTSELVRAGQHGVHSTYLREMGTLGYRLGSLEPLIELRDHGVTPTYIRELAEQGYKGLPHDHLRRARDHGITPEYVRGMRDAGHSSVPIEELINARDHGVTPEFVRALRDAGHDKVPLDQLIRVRDHGVSPEYVSQMREFGHALTLDELVRARDHGVDIPFVRDLGALGYGTLSMDSLVRLRDHGVTPEYVKELKTLGYDRLAPDDLVTLRDHGLTPDRIRAANARAGERLTIDRLKSLARGGTP
jgi:beta-lactamase regulating signal transducer with metallopeptidase domain